MATKTQPGRSNPTQKLTVVLRANKYLSNMFESIKQKTLSLSTIVGLAVALVIVLTVYGVWQVLWPTIQLNLNRPDPAVLSGRLVYSAALGNGIIPKTYSLDINNGAMKVTNESEKFKVIATSEVEFLSPDNSQDFFLRSIHEDKTSGTSTLVRRVLHANLPDKVDVVVEESVFQYGPMSWSSLKKQLARSLFVESSPSDEKVFTKSWKIVITDEKGVVVEELTDAFNPVWMPNSNVLLLLRSDGIYAYDTGIGAEVRLISLSDESGQSVSATIGTMFEVSPDGKRLVLTTPGTGNISVYEVAPTMDVKKLYSHQNPAVTYSWPLVSPDGKAMAVIARDITDQGATNPRVEFYTIDDPTFTMITSQSLSEYNPEMVYLDDWVK